MKIKTIILTLSLLFIAPLGLIAQKQLMPGQTMYHPNQSADNQLERLFRNSMNNDPAFDINAGPPEVTYSVSCVLPFNQCIGMFNTGGLREYDYQNYYMTILIKFSKNPAQLRLNGTVDIVVDGGQNPTHVNFQDVVWQYQNTSSVWVTISQSGLSFPTTDLKHHVVKVGNDYYLRLRFAPKNINIGAFFQGGGIPSGKYGFELTPRFTFVQLL